MEKPLNDTKTQITIIRENAEKAIKRVEKFTRSIEFESADHILLVIRLELLDENYKKFVQNNDLLTSLVGFEVDKAQELEESYIEIKALLQYKLECVISAGRSESANIASIQNNVENNDHVRLYEDPNISLPTYGDNETDFKSFMQAFTAQVGDNNKLTEKQKMDYLKSHLTGIPLEIAQEMSTNSYDDILQLLNMRYLLEKHAFRTSEKPPHIALHDIQEITKELYDSIIHGAYSHAVEVSKNVAQGPNRNIITDIIKRLIQDNSKNVISYIYSLWIEADKDALNDLIPRTFKTIFDQEYVVLINKKYGLALKLAAYTDNDGDREVWGDSKDIISKRVVWKLVPFWEDNRVFFKIMNIDCNMYLKLGLMADNEGDRGAFGAGTTEDGGDAIYAWLLEPFEKDGEILFRIINRLYSQGLKLAVAEDSMKDRRLFGHRGDIYKDDTRFSWYIRKYEL